MSDRRKIPTLAEYLDRSSRGEGFEKFLETTLLIAQADHLDEATKAAVRLMRPFSIALVEALRGEAALGRSPDVYIPDAAHAIGYALFLATFSGAKDSAPPLRLVDILLEYVRQGAVKAAKQQIKLAKRQA